MATPPPGSTPFPYTTLFRSRGEAGLGEAAHEAAAGEGVVQIFRNELAHGILQILISPAWAVGRWARNRSRDRKSTRLNASHTVIAYAVCCFKQKKTRGRGPQ